MKLLSPRLSVASGDLENEIFADLSLAFAHRPMFRFGFPLEEEQVEPLLEHFEKNIYRAFRWQDEEGPEWTEILFRFDSSSFAYLMNGYRKLVRIYAESRERALELERLIRGAMPPVERSPESPFFYMLRCDENEFSTEKIGNTSALMDDGQIRLCYGEEILPWIGAFSRETTGKAGGITILDGPPGSGKSSLIAQLMARLAASHVFYVLPVSQQESLSSPGMVAFWQEQNGRYPNMVKVIVMEDAEKILLQRRSDNNESVSALLNIADGLMGQMLKVHVLCTLNQGMEHLDPAILRPGRLRSYRYVGLLSREEAERLAAGYGIAFEPEAGRGAFTLAEVFHGSVYRQQAKSMGFHVRQP